MQVTVEQIVSEVQMLSAEDLRKLLDFIDSILEKESEQSEISEETGKIIEERK